MLSVIKNQKALRCTLGGVLFATVVTVAISGSANAWGPERDTFTIEKPASYVTFNSITDNPNYGDERNFLRIRDADSKYWVAGSNPDNYGTDGKNGWTDTMNMREGHTYDVKLYVHNNGVENKYMAENVRAHINLPTANTVFGKKFEVNGYLSSSNANPKEIWDNIVLTSNKDFHVKVVSQKYYNNYKTEDDGGFDLQDDIYTAKGEGAGALLGYDKMNGYLNSCYPYSGYVLLKIQPVFQTEPTTPPTDTTDNTENPKTPGAPATGSNIAVATASLVGFLVLAALAVVFLMRRQKTARK